MIRSIIIEGIDGLGKSTLIKGLMNRLGYFQVIHYQKPEMLDCIIKDIRRGLDLPDSIMNENLKSMSLKKYQNDAFLNMMKMLSSDATFILDRSHIGEFIYAPRYRGYKGDYVFELEKQFNFIDSTLLIVLHTSSFDFIKDDGLSLDFEQREDEQMDFIRAFEKSNIKHKLLLDVHNSKGNFVSSDRLIRVVIQAIHELPLMEYQIMHTYWEYDDNLDLNSKTYLLPDSNKIIN